jgi:glucokinase
MLLAGDVGGTKTFMGLFARGAARPAAVDTRAYRTLDFPDLAALSRQFLRDAGAGIGEIEAASFGVAGPVTGSQARLTNIPWVVDVDAMRHELPIPRAHLLNDLEALAWSVSVLDASEIETLREGDVNPSGNAALIAAGTGLGVALLPNIEGRLIPVASEGGHADFPARTTDEQTLHNALTRDYGRAEIEKVVSGPGIANIHRILYPHRCDMLTPLPDADELPAAISRAALEARCPSCTRILEVFVSAYGAVAGNLALTALSTRGMYLGGGIAPRIIEAMRWPVFMDAFLAKAPMDALVSRVPVKVILNPGAGLLGAATYANLVP